MGFLLRVAINALAIVLAASILPGIEVDGIVPALAAAVLLGLVNAFVRPVLLILTLPITLVTLGLFLLVLNGFCFWRSCARRSSGARPGRPRPAA